MKKLSLFVYVSLPLIFSLSLFIISGCKSDDIIITPAPTEIQMNNPGISDSISVFIVNASIIKTRRIGSSMLNFLDKDSTRISFSYKGSSTLSDTLFYITTDELRLYTLVDNAPGNTYKSVNVTVPSIKVNDYFSYTLYAYGDLPYVAIKDLIIYKK